tara:strand:+ start:1444 stop:1578 length:135 start_codon:yes stop_codon:yes gene_type:complete
MMKHFKLLTFLSMVATGSSALKKEKDNRRVRLRVKQKERLEIIL